MLFVHLALLPLSAKELTRTFFQDKPRSIIKDFYISEYLDQNISSSDAKSLIGDVHNMNYRLFYKFADKIDDFSFKRTKYCLKMQANQYAGKSDDCIAMGLSPYKATKLPSNILNHIADTLQTNYPKRAKSYKIIAAKKFETLMQADAKTALYTFNNVGSKFRQTYYNRPITSAAIESLSKYPGFNTMVAYIVRDPKLDILQKAILKLDASNLSAESNFLLAINAIKQNREDIALWYLKLSTKKAHLQFDKDKALFWHYLISKENKYLDKLLESKDINIYTLFAYEKRKVTPKNIYTSIAPKNKIAPFDVKDPFAWVNIRNKFKNQKFNTYQTRKAAAIKLNSDATEAHVATLIYRFAQNEHYFLKPYFQALAHLPQKRAALILAIARQESHFIPTAVSYSYALGMMQFMPYVAKDIAATHGFKDFSYEDMFDPQIAYKFADIHLDFLQKSLSHPLFVAYAYNGGLGYTKRQILQKDYFKEGKYEPFLSMEMLQNAQARKYGKKVLANYLIYAKLLGEKISLKTLLETLKPSYHKQRF